MSHSHASTVADYVRRNETGRVERPKPTFRPKPLKGSAADFSDLKIDPNGTARNSGPVDSAKSASATPFKAADSTPVERKAPFYATSGSDIDDTLTAKSDDVEKPKDCQNTKKEELNAEEEQAERKSKGSGFGEPEAESSASNSDNFKSSPPERRMTDTFGTSPVKDERSINRNVISALSARSYPDTTSGRPSTVDENEVQNFSEPLIRPGTFSYNQQMHGYPAANRFSQPTESAGGPPIQDMAPALRMPLISKGQSAVEDQHLGHGFAFGKAPPVSMVIHRNPPHQSAHLRSQVVRPENGFAPQMPIGKNERSRYTAGLQQNQSLHTYHDVEIHPPGISENHPSAARFLLSPQDRMQDRLQPRNQILEKRATNAAIPATLPLYNAPLHDADHINDNATQQSDRTPGNPLISPASEPELDYDRAELHNMDYETLKTQSFDLDPNNSDSGLPEYFKDQSLAQKLVYVAELPSKEQQTFFSSLTINEWEDAGDWYLDRFSDIAQRIKGARRAKRDAAQQFEAELQRRHETVSRKRKKLDDSLKEMKESGGRVLSATPEKIML